MTFAPRLMCFPSIERLTTLTGYETRFISKQMVTACLKLKELPETTPTMRSGESTLRSRCRTTSQKLPHGLPVFNFA